MKRVLFYSLIVTLLLSLAAIPGAAMPDRGAVAPQMSGSNSVETTWQITTVDSAGSVGMYPDLAVDTAGHPHIAYYDDSNDDLKYAYYNGSSWQVQTVDSAGTVGQYPSIAINSAGRPCIAYWGDGNIKYAYWTGSAWQIAVAAGGGWQSHFNSLALDASDRPHIAFYNTDSGGLRYAYNDGSWHTVDVETGPVGQYPAIDLDSSGHAGISYCQFSTSTWQCEALKYAHYNGSSWQIETVASGTRIGYYTSLGIDSAGRPHISYYDNYLFVLRYAYKDGGTWYFQTVDSTGYVGAFTSLQLDSAGRPRIGYYDLTNLHPKYAAYDGTTWAVETVDGASSVGSYTSLALDSSGGPHLSYYDEANADLKYAAGACTPLTGVTIGGPRSLVTGEVGAYTASPVPSTASTPIQYAWSNWTSGSTTTFHWHSPGIHTIVINASNACSLVGGSLNVVVTSESSRFGIDQYVTNANHDDNDVNTILQLSQFIGPRWAREEMIWENFDAGWGQDLFDQRLNKEFQAGFHIIGDIVTTPAAYSTQACKDWAQQNNKPWWWCPPANPADFANFCSYLTERYDGDGYLDAAGSPRISVWEVWNEPDTAGTFLPQPDPVLYTQMLCQCSQAIKAADPTAKVLFGGVYGEHTVGRNNFVDAVIGNGGWSCFDVLSYHIYEGTLTPEEPDSNRSMVAILDMVSNWLAAYGGGKELWVTEVGWSTAPGYVTEDQQANYMVRAHGLVFYHDWQQIDYFQFHDHGGGMGTPYAEMAIVTADYAGKQAYWAYGFMTTMLGNAQYIGPGWLNNVNGSWNDVYDLRFRRPDGTWVDLVWQLQGQTDRSFHVEPSVQQVVRYDRSGGTPQVLTPVNGYVTVTVSDRPCYLERRSVTTYGVFLPLIRR